MAAPRSQLDDHADAGGGLAAFVVAGLWLLDVIICDALANRLVVPSVRPRRSTRPARRSRHRRSPRPSPKPQAATSRPATHAARTAPAGQPRRRGAAPTRASQACRLGCLHRVGDGRLLRGGRQSRSRRNTLGRAGARVVVRRLGDRDRSRSPGRLRAAAARAARRRRPGLRLHRAAAPVQRSRRDHAQPDRHVEHARDLDAADRRRALWPGRQHDRVRRWPLDDQARERQGHERRAVLPRAAERAARRRSPPTAPPLLTVDTGGRCARRAGVGRHAADRRRRGEARDRDEQGPRRGCSASISRTRAARSSTTSASSAST